MRQPCEACGSEGYIYRGGDPNAQPSAVCDVCNGTGYREVPDETGWVLEHADSPTSQPRYWAAGQIDPLRSSAWTENNMAAIRFAREADAQAVSDRFMKKAGVQVRVCEHIWSAQETYF